MGVSLGGRRPGAAQRTHDEERPEQDTARNDEESEAEPAFGQAAIDPAAEGEHEQEGRRQSDAEIGLECSDDDAGLVDFQHGTSTAFAHFDEFGAPGDTEIAMGVTSRIPGHRKEGRGVSVELPGSKRIRAPTEGAGMGTRETIDPSSPFGGSPLAFAESRGRYRVRLAQTEADRWRVQRLRYAVFARELGATVEGAERGLDADPLDARVDHLLVVDEPSGECVGTYRLATLAQVGHAPGFYSRRQFDLARLDPKIEAEGVELGRACIALGHRNRGVLHLLLRGIGAYLVRSRKRFLFGCGSVLLKEPSEAEFVVRAIEREGWIDPTLEVAPTEAHRLPASSGGAAIGPDLPPLLHAYCAMGARLAARPAWDPHFRSLDFFVLLDRLAMDPRSAARYCGMRHERKRDR